MKGDKVSPLGVHQAVSRRDSTGEMIWAPGESCRWAVASEMQKGLLRNGQGWTGWHLRWVRAGRCSWPRGRDFVLGVLLLEDCVCVHVYRCVTVCVCMCACASLCAHVHVPGCVTVCLCIHVCVYVCVLLLRSIHLFLLKQDLPLA